MSEVVLMNRLKELRARKGLTQSQLAEAVGVTRKSVNTVENRKFVPSTILAFRIAQALDVSVEEAFWLEQISED